MAGSGKADGPTWALRVGLGIAVVAMLQACNEATRPATHSSSRRTARSVTKAMWPPSNSWAAPRPSAGTWSPWTVAAPGTGKPVRPTSGRPSSATVRADVKFGTIESSTPLTMNTGVPR